MQQCNPLSIFTLLFRLQLFISLLTSAVRYSPFVMFISPLQWRWNRDCSSRFVLKLHKKSACLLSHVSCMAERSSGHAVFHKDVFTNCFCPRGATLCLWSILSFSGCLPKRPVWNRQPFLTPSRLFMLQNSQIGNIIGWWMRSVWFSCLFVFALEPLKAELLLRQEHG